MCLIIHKPKGAEIEKWVIDSAKEYNADGIGIMSAGKIEKFMTIHTDKIYDRINKLDSAAIHFRMATHGTTDIGNCHPFKMSNGVFLMHNGVMNSYAAPKGSNDSDTANFIKEYCNPQIAIDGRLNLQLFEAAIAGQVMALMQKNGRITRHGGQWNLYNDCYFSNHYAWDSPNTWKPTKEYNVTDYTGPQDFDPVNGFGGYRSTDDMIDDFLFNAVFQLPLETEEYIDNRDSELYAEIWSGKIDCEQFVDDCSPETKINLFSYLIEKGLI